jgi:hypothetical protein
MPRQADFKQHALGVGSTSPEESATHATPMTVTIAPTQNARGPITSCCKRHAQPTARGVLGRLAPLAISMIPRPLISDRPGAFRREAGLREHPPQIDDDLSADIFAVRRGQHLRLRAKRNLELAVVFVRHRSNRLQQRHDLAPLDIAARGMAEDPLDRVAVMVAEVRFQSGIPSLVASGL